MTHLLVPSHKADQERAFDDAGGTRHVSELPAGKALLLNTVKKVLRTAKGKREIFNMLLSYYGFTVDSQGHIRRA
jgi:hypothetical protein